MVAGAGGGGASHRLLKCFTWRADEEGGEEEQEERESKDAEEKDIEFDLDEKGNSNTIFLQTTTLNAYIESTLQSQNHTKDISPPPKV